MNKATRSVGKASWVCIATVALTGCTTYVQEAPPHTEYIPPPEVQQPPPFQPPPTVIVQAPPVQPPPPVVIEAPIPVSNPVVVIQSDNDFYEPLRPYGEWVTLAAYGRCWRPRQVEVTWRPYLYGHWERTDAGWYWASDEPWGWATYHYGRWDWTPEYGWVWVPQTQWAPAWVTWREGDGYTGWAPLPPAATFSVSGTLDFRAAIAPPRFVFIHTPRMLEPVRPATVIVDNTTVINRTINVTKVRIVNRTVINEGPRLDNLERLTGRHIHAVPVSEVRTREETEAETRDRTNRGHLTGAPTHQEQPWLGGIKPARAESQPPTVVAPTPPPPRATPAPTVPPGQIRRIEKAPTHQEQPSLGGFKPARSESQPPTVVAPASAPNPPPGQIRRIERAPKTAPTTTTETVTPVRPVHPLVTTPTIKTPERRLGIAPTEKQTKSPKEKASDKGKPAEKTSGKQKSRDRGKAQDKAATPLPER